MRVEKAGAGEIGEVTASGVTAGLLEEGVFLFGEAEDHGFVAG